MKKLFYISLIALTYTACKPTADKAVVAADGSSLYGEEITADGAISLSELITTVNDQGSYEGKVEAEITGTCAKKGCWMTLKNDVGEDVRVKFKDYGFFVPVEGQEGKTTIIEGFAKLDTVSVELRRHYAEDGGATPEEIEMITEPEYNVSFLADGVIIK